MFDSSNHPHEGLKWNKQWSFTLMNAKHPIATTFEYYERLATVHNVLWIKGHFPASALQCSQL